MKKIISFILCLFFVVLMQAQNETIQVANAGSLNSLINKNDTSIIVTGTIDARDFLTMRDSMPSLKQIDLSGATITTYTGAKGTYLIATTYPANQIPTYAFNDLITYKVPSNLTSVILPTSINSIGEGAFEHCTKLKNIYISESITSIPAGAFSICGAEITVNPNNPIYSSNNGALYNKTQNKILQCPSSKKGIFNIPTSVTNIGDGAFVDCVYLDSIHIPTSVTTIEGFAFQNCSGLRSITFPESIKTIKSGLFWFCTGASNLVVIRVLMPIPVDLHNSTQVFYNVDTSICKLKVPYGAEAAYRDAFQWNEFSHISAMDGFWISSHDLSFSPEASESTIDVKANVSWTVSSDQSWVTVSPLSGNNDGKLTINTTPYNNSSFRYATITISSNGIPSQKITVVQGNTITITAGNLSSSIPTEIKNNINTLSIKGTIDARDFATMRDSMPNLTKIDLSGASIVSYSGYKGTGWIGYYETYPANEIPKYAFKPQNNISKTILQSITLPSTANSIGERAFKDCYNINSPIYISSSIISIKKDAFVDCGGDIIVSEQNPNYSSIEGVLFDKSQDSIIHCPITKKGNYSIPNSVSIIADNAFNSCVNITNITIPTSVTSIGESAFYACERLTSSIIPSSVTSIGKYAYFFCSRIQTITIPAVITSIGDQAFYTCMKLTKLIIFNPNPVDLSNSVAVFTNDKNATLYVPCGSLNNYKTAVGWKDIPNIVEDCSIITLSNDIISFSHLGGSSTVDVSSNTSWNVTSNEPWLTFNTNSTINNGTITLQAAPNQNSERTAIVTVSDGYNIVKTISVTQLEHETEIPTINNSQTVKHFQIKGNVIQFDNSQSSIYNLLGVLLSENKQTVTLPNGVYFIKSNEGVEKVVIEN